MRAKLRAFVLHPKANKTKGQAKQVRDPKLEF